MSNNSTISESFPSPGKIFKSLHRAFCKKQIKHELPIPSLKDFIHSLCDGKDAKANEYKDILASWLSNKRGDLEKTPKDERWKNKGATIMAQKQAKKVAAQKRRDKNANKSKTESSGSSVLTNFLKK